MYKAGQKVILERMHGMWNAPAEIMEVNYDHAYIKVITHGGLMAKVTLCDIIGTAD